MKNPLEFWILCDFWDFPLVKQDSHSPFRFHSPGAGSLQTWSPFPIFPGRVEWRRISRNFWNVWPGTQVLAISRWSCLEFQGKFFKKHCWWKTSCTSWYVKYPITYRVFVHPSNCRWLAGFLPSTVSQVFSGKDGWVCNLGCPGGTWPDGRAVPIAGIIFFGFWMLLLFLERLDWKPDNFLWYYTPWLNVCWVLQHDFRNLHKFPPTFVGPLTQEPRTHVWSQMP